MSQKQFGIKSAQDKKLFLELTKKYGCDVMASMRTIDELNLQKDNSYRIQETRSADKTRGSFTITVFKKIIIPNTTAPYDKEVKKLKIYPNGQPSKIEYYDRNPGLPDRADGQLPAIVEWWPSGDKKRETYYKNNVIHRDGGPADISYDRWGDPIEQKFFTLGVPKEKIDAGKKQEKEFNQASLQKEKDRLVKDHAKHKEQLAAMNKTTDIRAPKKEDPIEKGWKEKSGDERVDVDLDNEFISQEEPLGQILNKKINQSDFTWPSEMRDEDSETGPFAPRPTPRPQSAEAQAFSRDDVSKEASVPKNVTIKNKSLYDKIISGISSFLMKKHKDKLSPETLQKVVDYYTKLAPTKKSPEVQSHHKKEFTGRSRDEFPIGNVRKEDLNIDLLKDIISEAVELTDDLVEKYKDRLFKP